MEIARFPGICRGNGLAAPCVGRLAFPLIQSCGVCCLPSELSSAARHIIIPDLDETYSIGIENNVAYSSLSEAENPDISITIKQEDVIKVLESENPKEEIIKLAEEGNINLAILADEKKLALKGYKAIYDSMS